MEITFIIPGRLPCLNDFYKATLRNRFLGNQMKKNQEEEIGKCIITNPKLRNMTFTKPVVIHYTWYEATRKRDLDNISSFGRKCIQDALVRNHILENDGWKNIIGFSDSFYIDKENPRIEVTITEVENEEDVQ